jgi:hypothetical protein
MTPEKNLNEQTLNIELVSILLSRSPIHDPIITKNPITNSKGAKHDSGKQPWYAMPLSILQPLADVFAAGEKKYSTFNCMQPFDDPERRFWDATMRHLSSCQLNPLAIDKETGCYHAAQAVFSILMRIHNAQKKASIQEEEAGQTREEAIAREIVRERLQHHMSPLNYKQDK